MNLIKIIILLTFTIMDLNMKNEKSSSQIPKKSKKHSLKSRRKANKYRIQKYDKANCLFMKKVNNKLFSNESPEKIKKEGR